METGTQGDLVTRQDHTVRELPRQDLDLDHRDCKGHSILSSTWKSSNEWISSFFLFFCFFNTHGREESAEKCSREDLGRLCRTDQSSFPSCAFRWLLGGWGGHMRLGLELRGGTGGYSWGECPSLLIPCAKALLVTAL